MITETEVAWLGTRYPNLSVSPDRTEVSGEIIFAAAYDEATDTFTPLTLPGQTAPGLTLRGSYVIAINGRGNSLPLLRVVGGKIDLDPDRHFYTSGAGCLCGPVEELEFMKAGFSFQRYLEHLVYPFLYGQLFCDLRGKWPWSDYPHGAAGVFESYYRSGQTKEHLELCMRRLPADTKRWARVQAVLMGRERVNGGDDCFCWDKHKIKDHMVVWYALLKFKKDMVGFGVPLHGQGSEEGALSK